MRLPDIDGDEVLQRLRDDPLTSAIPVVIVSADAIDRHIQRRLESGASAYLTKPVDTRLLMEIVDE
jgi:CheY-like chemotaxis protein